MEQIPGLRSETWGTQFYVAKLVVVVQGFEAEINRSGAEFFFDAEELVVLGDAIGAAGGAGLDLANAGGDSKIGDEGVFTLAGTMRHDSRVAVATAEVDGFQRLGQGANLVDLDENGIGHALFDAALQALHVGYEEVVADEL